MSYYLQHGVVSIDDGIVPLATPCCVDCPTIRIWDFPSQQHVGLIQLNYRQLQGDDDFGSMKYSPDGSILLCTRWYSTLGNRLSSADGL